MSKKSLSELDDLLGLFKVDEKTKDIEMLQIRLELAPCQGLGLMHNGNMYLHGGTYHVSRAVANDLEEMSRRGMSHEAAITKQETAGRRRRNLDVNTPVGVVNPTTGAMQYF